MKGSEEHKKHKHVHTERTLEDLLEALKKNQLKVTKPRKAILEVLIAHHGPFTAQEIHKLINKKVCDQATVYRCLINLVDAKMLRRVEFGDSTTRFELCEPDGTHHHHVICTECKRIEIIDDDELEEIDRFAKKHGFTNIQHTIEFFGTCPQCK